MTALKVMLVAGEPSGDLLGASLMAALKAARPDISFVGIGGPGMEHHGLRSIVPFEDLSVMGLVEVLPRLRRLARHLRTATEFAVTEQPAVIVTIDSPGFSFRLAERLRTTAIKKVHFVAPSVWAWRPGRAAKIAPLYDHLLALLPFEPPYFERVGLPTTFVGHPVVERTVRGDGTAFRERHGIQAADEVLIVLPGSRTSETRRLLPVFSRALERIASKHPKLRVVVPTVAGVAETVRTAAESWPGHPVVVLESEKADAFAAGDTALAASGTVALELAIAGVPMVVAYDVNAVSAFIARRLSTTEYVNLVNIILDKPVVPELLLEDCRPGPIAEAVEDLMTSTMKREAQRAAFGEAIGALNNPVGSPSEVAARTVLQQAEAG